MFARCVTMRLKPNTAAHFQQTMASEVLPMLKRQQGFHDEMVLMSPDGKQSALASGTANRLRKHIRNNPTQK